MSLLGEAPPARVREHDGASAGLRDIRLCQVPTCRAFARRRIEIELPAAWEGSTTYTVLTVAVGACDEHGPELERRAATMLEARADLFHLLTIVEGAVRAEAELREQIDRLSAGRARP